MAVLDFPPFLPDDNRGPRRLTTPPEPLTKDSPLFHVLRGAVLKGYSCCMVASRSIGAALRDKFKIGNVSQLRAQLLDGSMRNSWFMEEYIHDTMCLPRDPHDAFVCGNRGTVTRLPPMFGHLRHLLPAWSDLPSVANALHSAMTAVPDFRHYPPGIVPLICSYCALPYCMLSQPRPCSIDAVLPPNFAFQICMDGALGNGVRKEWIEIDAVLDVVRALRPQLVQNPRAAVAPVNLISLVPARRWKSSTAPFPFPRSVDRVITPDERDTLACVTQSLYYWKDPRQ
jgi:hypothetical protein